MNNYLQKVILLASSLSTSLTLLNLPIGVPAFAQAKLLEPTLRLRYNDGGRGQVGHTTLDLVAPLSQSGSELGETSNLFYISPKLQVFNNGRFGSGLLFGYRFFNQKSNNLLGTWIAYDNRDTQSNFFQQISAGFEFLTDQLDLSLNGFVPVGTTRKFLGDTYSGQTFFEGTTLFLERNQNFVQALTGVEFQGGYAFNFQETGYVRPYAGVYYLEGTGSGSTVGIKGGLTYANQWFSSGISVEHDNILGTSVRFTVGLNVIGSRRRRPQLLLARLSETPIRNSTIFLVNQSLPSNLAAINPATGQPFEFFVVSNDATGLRGNPNLSPATDIGLANALGTLSNPNRVVYVYTANAPANFISAVTVPDGVKLVSSAAPNLPFNALFAGTPVPNFGGLPVNTGTLPLISNTISLAHGSAQAVIGFDVRPTDRIGITGHSNENPLIQYNIVAIQGNDTSLMTNAQGIFLRDASGDVRILDNQVSNALREGIRLDRVTGTVLIDGNEVNGTRTAIATNDLEGAIFINNNSGFVDITVSNNTVTNTNGNADGIEFNLCRFNGDTPIASCTGGASAIVRVLNNTINSTERGDGIDFNLLSGSQTIAIIDGNTITGIADKGITFGADGNATFAAIISNNNITTDPTIATSNETRGISLNLGATANGVDGVSPVSLGGLTVQGTLIEGNMIDNTEQSGIILRTRNNAQLSAVVRNNTVTNTNQLNDTDHAGIKVRAQNTSQQTVIVENNTVQNSGVSGINVRAANTAIVRATVRGNIVTNANTSNNSNEAGILARSQDTARVCIRLENNSSLNPLSAADYRFRRQAGGAALEVFNLGTAIPVGAPSMSLQTFLTSAPQSNIGGLNKFFVTNNSVQVPTAACAFP